MKNSQPYNQNQRDSTNQQQKIKQQQEKEQGKTEMSNDKCLQIFRNIFSASHPAAQIAQDLNEIKQYLKQSTGQADGTWALLIKYSNAQNYALFRAIQDFLYPHNSKKSQNDQQENENQEQNNKELQSIAGLYDQFLKNHKSLIDEFTQNLVKYIAEPTQDLFDKLNEEAAQLTRIEIQTAVSNAFIKKSDKDLTTKEIQKMSGMLSILLGKQETQEIGQQRTVKSNLLVASKISYTLEDILNNHAYVKNSESKRLLKASAIKEHGYDKIYSLLDDSLSKLYDQNYFASESQLEEVQYALKQLSKYYIENKIIFGEQNPKLNDLKDKINKLVIKANNIWNKNTQFELEAVLNKQSAKKTNKIRQFLRKIHIPASCIALVGKRIDRSLLPINISSKQRNKLTLKKLCNDYVDL